MQIYWRSRDGLQDWASVRVKEGGTENGLFNWSSLSLTSFSVCLLLYSLSQMNDLPRQIAQAEPSFETCKLMDFLVAVNISAGCTLLFTAV